MRCRRRKNSHITTEFCFKNKIKHKFTRKRKPQTNAKSFSLFTFGQSNISIWFPPAQGNEVKSEIINLINSASKSLYVAVYDINDSDIVSALLLAHKKGTGFNVIMDDERAETEKDIVSPLNSAGILKTDNNKSALMHDKSFLIDGQMAITGSYNPTNQANTEK